tara:strand:+ start:442 stop:921 length:480 start_codon:yes stop_codon:yes gene_type:complete
MKTCNHKIRELLLTDLDDNYFTLLCELSGETQRLKKSVIKSCWDKYINNVNHCTFVYEDLPEQPHLAGKIIGTASVLIEHKMLHYGSRVGHIEDVVVTSRTRNTGVGRSLVEKCLEHCRNNHCYKVILDCSNKNIPFYESCGFRVAENCMRIDLNYDFL